MMMIAFAVLTAAVLIVLLTPLKSHAKTSYALALLIAGGALGLYLWQGHPELPDQPIAARLAARQVSLDQVAIGVDKLQAHLAQEPDDVQGWLLLAQGQAALGHPDKEREALQRVLALLPDEAPIKRAIAAKLAPH